MNTRLEERLTLASLGIIAIFLLTFGLTWMIVGRHAMMAPRGGMVKHMSEALSESYSHGGWPAVESTLRLSLLPPEVGITLVLAGGERQVIQGDKTVSSADETETAARVMREGSVERHGFDGMEHWAVIYGPKGAVGTCHIVFQDHRHREQRWQWLSAMLLSALLAALVASLVGWWGSRTIARPILTLVEATRALANSDYHHRISTAGPGELSQLADSFNTMAAHLETTVDSLTAAKEKAERSEASRRQFLADVSHNLRTPMAAVLGWTEALIDGLTPGEEKLHLRNIHQETIYLSQNVQRLLDWSRWEESPPKLHYETFPVSEPLMECVQNLGEAAESKSIDLSLQGLEEDYQVRGDRLRVRELFQLFLENAVQHTPAGTRVEVAFATSELPRTRLEVTISDNGPGLPEELSRDLQCRVGGGLGLAIASRLAKAHGGQLELLETGPQGTRLRFTLELA